MPEPVKDIDLAEKVAILKTVKVFAETDQDVLVNIAKVLTEEHHPKDSLIIKKGDPGESMYIIVDGAVRVHDGNYTFVVLRNRNVFGEYALLDTKPRSADVTTLRRTRLWKLNQDVFYKVMMNHIQIMRGILRVLIRRSRNHNVLEEELVQQKKSIEAQNEEITTINSSLELKNAIIEEKNYQIQDSILYAKHIQTAMVPTLADVKSALPNSFIFWQPKDIVSGDFYWYAKTVPRPIYEETQTFEGIQKIFKGFDTEKVIITAVDCTGHGVPGAFMSMLGANALNRIVELEGITEPDLILHHLHKSVQNALRQRTSENRDGMDMALCVIDKEQRTVAFSGAKSPLFYIQNNELHQIKGGMMPIGGHHWEDHERMFAKHTIKVDQPTVFYIFSDGYRDQFGGPREKKFMLKQFKELLLEIHLLPFNEQHDILEKKLNDWRGYIPQTDDVIVIGFKID
ncbi:cyclic nucleotide-binding domain-containing protein [uncultured Microscilla sp.]|uniref:cyclic nucleotide-binding domain-containing protein n=1 Tax=uncultured Microscilla sp. TaxID=432653 RepID=UPI002635792D|nr:cyclic nucleotide-binding domain-containing protein [uncultured Microscilla sp.]